MTASLPRVTVVVLAYGDEPVLVECVEAVLRSELVDVDVVLVDNGADPDQVQRAAALGEVGLLAPPTNLGFAGGCNAAARRATGDYLAFVNSDAVVDPGCLHHLVTALEDESVGLVSASVRLSQDPATVNSAGNPVQYLFFSWAGGHGEPATAHAARRMVASISGATFAVRRPVWERLGGFDDTYFAYGEDVDLSWRTWQAGLQVWYEPSGVSVHHYEFARNPRKLYLLERNRLMNYLTLTERRTRRALAPVFLLVEVGVLVAASRDGWSRQKVDGWRWLWHNRQHLLHRRSRVAASRVVADEDLGWLWQASIDPAPGLGPSVPGVVNTMLEGYWRAVRPLLEGGRRRRDRRGGRRTRRPAPVP